MKLKAIMAHTRLSKEAIKAFHDEQDVIAGFFKFQRLQERTIIAATLITIIALIASASAIPVGGEIYYDFENQVNNQWYTFGYGIPVNVSYRALANSPSIAGFFNGTSRINTTLHPVIDQRGTNYTILFKFMHNTSIGTLEALFSQLRAPGDTRLFLYINATGHVIYNFLENVSVAGHEAKNQTYISPFSNTWQTFAIVHNETSVTLYLNGTQIYKNASIGKIVSENRPPLFIGTSANGFILNYNGGLDNFKTFNRSLSLDEILFELTDVFSNTSYVAAQDIFGSQQIVTFNVSWANNTDTITNTTTTGQAQYSPLSGFYNITVTAAGYYANTTYNYNVSYPLSVSLSAGRVFITSTTAGFTTSIYNTLGVLLGQNTTSTQTNYLTLAGILTSGTLQALSFKTGYTLLNTTFTFNRNDTYLTYNPLINPAIFNISVYDEETLSTIQNVTFQFVSNTSNNYTTTNGSLYIDNLPGGNYEIIYDANGYYLRRYFLTVTSSGYYPLRLYLLNDTKTNNELVLFTLTDENGIALPACYISALRQFPALNAYQTVEMARTDTNGEGGMHLQLIEPSYYYTAVCNGTTVMTSSPGQVFTQLITLRSALTASYINQLAGIQGIITGLTYNNASYAFTYTGIDTGGLLTQTCMTITQPNIYGDLTINNTCVTAGTTTIILGSGARAGEYRAVVTGTSSGRTYILRQLDVRIGADAASEVGLTGVIGAIMLITALALTGAFSPVVSIVLSIVGIIVTVMMGILSLTVGALFVLGVIAGLLLYSMRRTT